MIVLDLSRSLYISISADSGKEGQSAGGERTEIDIEGGGRLGRRRWQASGTEEKTSDAPTFDTLYRTRSRQIGDDRAGVSAQPYRFRGPSFVPRKTHLRLVFLLPYRAHRQLPSLLHLIGRRDQVSDRIDGAHATPLTRSPPSRPSDERETRWIGSGGPG